MTFARRRACRTSAKALSPFVAALLLSATALATVGCRNWDFYDPRLGKSSTSTGATTSGAGGAATGTSVTSTSSSSATATSSASSSSTGTPVHCGGTNALSDDFPGTDLNDNWSPSVNGTTVAEMGGQLVVTYPNSPTQTWGSYQTNRYYDLQNDAISVEVPTVPNSATTASAVFVVSPGGGANDYVQFGEGKGTFVVAKHIGGVYTNLKSAPYDAVNDLYWRIREASGVTYFETSANGATWNVFTQANTSSLFPMNLVQIQIGGGTSGGEVNPGSAAFAKVNGGGAAVGQWCSVGSISDDFVSTTRGPLWYRSGVSAPETMSQGGGALLFTLAANAAKSGSYHSSASYSLTGQAASVHAAVAPNTSESGQMVFGLEAPGNNSLFFVESKATLYLRYTLAGVKSDVTLLYDPVGYAWWRMREAAGMIYWDTSPDGKAWTAQRQVATPFAIDTLDVVLSASTYVAEASPGTSQFSSFNITPP